MRMRCYLILMGANNSIPAQIQNFVESSERFIDKVCGHFLI